MNIIVNLRLPVFLATCLLITSFARGEELHIPYKSLRIYLYQPDAVLKARLGDHTKELADYISAINDSAGTFFTIVETQTPITGAIVVVVKPMNHSRVWVTLKSGLLSPKLVKELKDRLESIKPIDVQTGVFVFAIDFNAWGGSASEPQSNAPPIPKEWKEAARVSGGGTIDSLLESVWPDE